MSEETISEMNQGIEQQDSGLLLEAKGLMKAYRGRRVVKSVSLNVRPGEVVGLLGPNGAGKTTSFYMITGLIQPDEGQIFFKGLDVSREPMILSSTVIFRKIDGSWARYPIPIRTRIYMGI